MSQTLLFMDLKDAIKVHAFRSEGQRTMVNILYTCNYLNARFKNLLKPFDLTQQQFNILRILKGQYPKKIRVSDVKDRMVDRNSDITRIVNRMLKKDLITREPGEKDKRQMILSVTKAGLKKLEQVNPLIEEFEESIFQFSKKDMDCFNDFLDQIRS